MMPLRVFLLVYRYWGWVVTFRSWRYVALVLLPSALWPISAWGQATTGTSIGSQGTGSETVVVTVDLSVHLKDPDGKPVQGQAVVTLTKLSGEFYRQETTRNGHVVFTFVAPTEYNVQVVAQAYQRTLKYVDAQSGKSVTDVSVEMHAVSAEDLALAAR